MRRKIIIYGTILSIIILFYYAFSHQEMKLYSIISSDMGEYRHTYLTVVLNRLYVDDLEECSAKIIEKCLDNSFPNMKFSYDHTFPNELSIQVYLTQWHLEHNKLLYSFEYQTHDNAIHPCIIIFTPYVNPAN